MISVLSSNVFAQGNQTSNQQQGLDPVALLNTTNTAMTALNEGNATQAEQTLSQLQQELINATGKQVVVIVDPSSPPTTSDEFDSEGDDGESNGE